MAGKLRFLPFLGMVSGGLAVLAAIAGYIFRGWAGALGAGLGVILIALLFVLSSVVIVWVESINLHMMLPATIGVYTVKLCLLTAILGAVSQSGWAGFLPMLWGIVAGVVGWAGGYVVWIRRARLPYVEV